MLNHLNRTIVRVQKFSKVDIRYLLSGGFFLLLAQITSAAAGLLLTIAFANYISPEVYGTYKYILATYSLIAIAALPGIDTALQRAVARGEEKSFTIALFLKARWSLLGSLASFLYGAYNFYEGIYTLGIVFFMIGLALPVIETGALYTAYYNAKRQYRTWAIVEITSQALSVGSLLIAMSHSKGVIVLIIGYLLPYLLLRPIICYIIVRNIDDQAKESTDMHTYAQSITFFQVLTRIILSIDQIILFHFLGPVSVATFSIANAIPTRIKGLLKITGTLAFPKLVDRSGYEIYQSMPRKMFLFCISILLICFVYVISVPYIFTAIFPKYHDSILYSQVLVFFTLSGITYPYSSYLFANKKITENYVFAISSFIAKIVSLLIFIPLYGVWGAVISILAAAATTIVCAFYFIYRDRAQQ